jgi:hypothetical protein
MKVIPALYRLKKSIQPLGKAMSVQSCNPGATLTVASEAVALKCTRLHLIAPQKMKLRFSSRPRLGVCGAEPGTGNIKSDTFTFFNPSQS